MRRHLRNPWVWVMAALLFAGWLLWPRAVKSPAPERAPTPAAAAPAPSAARVSGFTSDDPALASLPAFLPDEARRTVGLIARGGPFPHRQDGVVFGNREGHLPSKPRGYYREYTVDTPGVDHRGARRIVTGGWPPQAWYYTDDHYDSFRSFDVGALDVSHAGSGR
jgi:guanyl-specific ribonuclease Sa